MRISFYFNSDGTHLPKDYRRGFLSIIKSALARSDPSLFKLYYEGKFKIKPFTFSVFFPGGIKFENDQFITGENFILNFSTNSKKLASHIYNGMFQLFYEPYKVFDNLVRLERVYIHPPKLIKKSEIRFQTISPMLVTNKDCHIEKDGNQYDIYLTPDDEGFDEGIRFLVNEQIKEFLGTNSLSFHYEIIKESCQIVPIWHYNQWNKSVKTVIVIKSNPEVLQLLYDTGIGARRSQGFGMLEVIG